MRVQGGQPPILWTHVKMSAAVIKPEPPYLGLHSGRPGLGPGLRICRMTPDDSADQAGVGRKEADPD